MATRERTAFPPSLIARLPRLNMRTWTGQRAASIDLAGMAERGVIVCGTSDGGSGAATADLALALMFAAAYRLPTVDAAARAGWFEQGTTPDSNCGESHWAWSGWDGSGSAWRAMAKRLGLARQLSLREAVSRKP
jgi:phosphoglycerate dehydrogenase-like enzyme